MYCAENTQLGMGKTQQRLSLTLWEQTSFHNFQNKNMYILTEIL